MDRAFFHDKQVLIMGLGRFGGGLDSALFAAKAGANVLVTDLAEESDLEDSLRSLRDYDIKYCLGQHREEDFQQAQIVIVNPAVPPDNKLVQIARKAGALVTSQMELFFQLCPARIIGITGANGKSTTTSLAAHLLNAGSGQEGVGYGKLWLGGNIGHQPLLDIVNQVRKEDLVVLEISNFQLEQLSNIQTSPDIALITNLTANHLDRHGTFEAYCRVKEHIFEYQSLDAQKPAISIFNAEDSITRAWYQKYLDETGRKCLAFSADDVPDEFSKIFQLPGRANRSNLAAALAIMSCFDVDPTLIKEAIQSFTGLPNRCQFIAETNGVRWYDDSKATTPVSTMAAINGIDEPKILIAGGYDKQIGFGELGTCIAQRAKAAVLIGQTASKIAEAVNSAGTSTCVIRYADSMEQAVSVSAELADPGDVVLMSPACASYDMFKNYTQRSEVFVQAVKTLKMSEQKTNFVFDPVAVRYDRCNHLFSLGMDHLWRKELVKTAGAHSLQNVLDLCCGTGDVVFSFLKHSPVKNLTGVDISEAMIDLAHEKQILFSGKQWMRNNKLSWKVSNAVQTGLQSAAFDFVTCAFGIRNISDRRAALSEINRVLKPKGKLCILEFSLPSNPLLRFFYNLYLCRIMPQFGKMIVGAKEPLQYLAQSIQDWHTKVDFSSELDQSGFKLIRKTPLTYGIVTLWVAIKNQELL